MPQPQGSSFADDLARVRASSPQPAGDDFAADLARVRTSPDPATMSDLERTVLGLPPKPLDDRSLFAKGVDVATTPLVPQIAEGGSWLANQIDTAERPAGGGGIFEAIGAIPEVLRGVVAEPAATLRGGVAGLVEGASQVAASFTSPLDAALTLTGLKGVRTAAGALGSGARLATQVGSGALAARGAERVVDAESGGEAGAGGLQALLGIAGVRGARLPTQPAARPMMHGQLRAAPITVGPEGSAVLPGQASIAMRQTGPGAYGPELPAGRSAPVVDFDPQGGPIYGGDPSAASVTRPVRGLLPERAEAANELIPTPGGRVARRGDVTPGQSLVEEAGQVADDFASDLAQVRGETVPAGTGKGRHAPAREPSTRPAAIMDREWDGAQETRRIYSSDPHAVDAPRLQAVPDELHELRRMHAEMANIEYTPRTFNEVDVGRGGAMDVVGGGAGASVYDDVTRGYTSKPTRAQVAQGIEDALSGTHSALGQRALAIARGRREGDPMLNRPQLPDDAGDLPQTGRQGDDDFSEFDRFVNRLSAEGVSDLGGLGEAGAINPMLLARMGGGAAGAASGVATSDENDTTAQRVMRGVVGGVLGAALPSLARSPSGGRLTGRLIARPSTGAPAAPSGMLTGTLRAIPKTGDFPTTGRAPAAPGRPHADPLAGTDVFVSKFAPELQTGIREVLERNGGFDAQRRGVINHEETARLAEGLAIDATRRLKPGTALNASGVRAFADSLATAQARLNELTGRVARGANTDADLLALQQAQAEHAVLAASVMGARAEAGRALAEFKIMARVLASGNPTLIRETANGLRGEAAEFAGKFAELPPDPMRRYRWLQAQRQPSVMERARSYYFANILSGLKTHERNTIGNAANLVSHLAVHPFAVAADAVRSAATGQPRTLQFSELPSQAAGALVGVEHGISNAIFALKHGVNRQVLSGALSAAEAGKLDVPRIEFGGGGANPFNWPGRALDGADQFFRSVARDMELYGAAHAQAKSEGLTGARLEQRMAALTSGTDEIAQQVQAHADTFARRSVFQETPGPITQAVQGALRAFPPLSLVLPFVKTPSNILRQGLEFSPAGFLMQAARQGGRAGAQAQGRAVAGSMALGGLVYLAIQDKLSGSGPSNPAERAQLMESGWRPNSLKVGDQWVSYSLFQPLSVPAAVVANAVDAWRAQGANPKQADDVAGRVLSTLLQTGGASAESLLDQSFLSGVADAFDLVKNRDRPSAERTVGRMVQSLTPFAGAQRTVRDAVDPMVRAPEGLSEQLKAGMPFLSTSVPARQDRFGQDVRREGGPLRRAADPFNVSTESGDPVLAELGRLGVKMGMPGASITGVDLSRDQERSLVQMKGSTAYQAIQRLLDLPGYQALDGPSRAAVVERVIEQARGQVQTSARKMLRGTLITRRTP